MNVWFKRVGIAGAAALGVGAVGSALALASAFWYYGRGLASLDEASLRDYRPPVVTRVYARDGELIGELFEQRRTVVAYADVPSHVENAFLAAEDADFYRHEGMDFTGMVRALVANLRAGKVKQGASTITQQVVKTFILSSERTLERKVQELILARRVEQALTKAEILELYLNEIYLGHGRYGIEEASQFYFGRPVTEINLGQAALLATLPKAPGRDSPLQHPDKAKARQVYVLEQMVKHGLATQADAQPFIDGELELVDAAHRTAPLGGAEEFVDLALARLESLYGKDALASLGAKVYTSVSMAAQRAARESALNGLAAIDQRNGYARGLVAAEDTARSEALAEAARGALSVGRTLRVVVSGIGGGSVPDDGFTALAGERSVFVRVEPGSRYDDPKQTLAEQFPVGAIVPVRISAAPAASGAGGRSVPPGWAEARVDAGPEAAVVVVEVESGEVLALVGGSCYARGDFNRATDARRQPGSSFKPFVYGAAIASGRYTAATLLDDSPEVYADWKPSNYRRDRYRGSIRARVALAKSVNTIPVKLTDELGPRAVTEFAHALGIESPLPENLSIALGTGEVSPFEMARAYLTLARGGERIEPVTVTRVDVPGRDSWTPNPVTRRVLPPAVAYVLTSMLQSVVTEGTGRKALALGKEAAGKTGTSNESRDAWFAGYTPDHVAISWVGFDQPRRVGKGETGGKAALPIWLGAARAVSGSTSSSFVPPATVSVRTIDADSGLLAPTGAAAAGYTGPVLEEYFVAGTEPVEEAVPAALPNGDVVLDLYDGGPSEPP